MSGDRASAAPTTDAQFAERRRLVSSAVSLLTPGYMALKSSSARGQTDETIVWCTGKHSFFVA